MALSNKVVGIDIKLDTKNAERNSKKLGQTLNKTSKTGKKAGQVLSGAMKAIGIGIMAAVAGAMALFRVFQKSVKLWFEQKKAVNGMNIALKNAGLDVRTLTKDYQDFASELQKTTGVGDEFTLDLIKQATQMGISQDKMKQVVKTTVDMKDAGIGTKMALQGMAQILQGEGSSALDRYVPKLKEWRKQGLTNVEMMERLTKTFKGQAIAMNEAMGGSRRLKSAWGDLQEIIGKIAFEDIGKGANVFNRLSEILESITVWLDKNSDKISEFVRGMLNTMVGGFKALVLLPKSIIKSFMALPKIFKDLFKIIFNNAMTWVLKLVKFTVDTFQKGLNKIPIFKGLDIDTSGMEKAISKFEGRAWTAGQSIKKNFGNLFTDIGDDVVDTFSDTFKKVEKTGKDALKNIAIPKQAGGGGGDAGKTVTAEMKKQLDIMQTIGDKTGGLIGDTIDLGKAIGGDDPTAIAGAWVQVLDTVSALAFQMYEIYETTGDWGEAMETTLAGIVEQIPILGRWIAKAIDDLWKTDTEKREKAMKDISEAEKKFQHDVAMGRVESTQAQIDHYENHLNQIKEAGADIDEIRSTEEKIFSLRKQQTAELEKQRKVIRDNLRLEGDFRIIAEENIKAGVEFLENKKAGIEGDKAYWEGQKSRSERIIAEQEKELALNEKRHKEIYYSVEKYGKKESYTAQQWADLQKYGEEMKFNLRVIQNHTEAIDIDNEKIKEQQKLLDGVKNELANYGDELVRLEIKQFEHRKRMGETTVSEELDFYEMILEKMRERNSEIEGDIQELLGQGIEFTDEQVQALQSQLFNLDEIYSTDEKILDLKEAQTAELEKQAGLTNGMTNQQKMMVDQLKQQIELGILDVANIADFGTIATALQGVGLRGMGLASQLGGLGITGDMANRIEAINVNITNNQAGADLMGQESAGHIANIISGSL